MMYRAACTTTMDRRQLEASWPLADFSLRVSSATLGTMLVQTQARRKNVQAGCLDPTVWRRNNSQQHFDASEALNPES